VFRNAVGKHLADVLTHETAGRFMECLQESIAARTTGVYQYELVAENSASVYEARIVAHAAHEALAIIRDVTDREVIDQGLNRAERLAAIGTLATSIAHELNNPIGAALLSAETILSLPRSADSSEQVDVCLRNIVESLARCGAIIRHLLNFAKDQPAETQAQEVNALLCRSCDLTRLYAERAGVQLEVIENADLPLIEASPLDLELVLVNLIHNAVHSRSHGVHVRVGAELREDTILLFVEDNGRGMTSEELSRVLEPFYTTRRHDGGTGLGLHVANRIVREYGGELIFRSVVGQGTRVSVALPLNRLRASIG
jgi:two-component system NtrC family sensor kinase